MFKKMHKEMTEASRFVMQRGKQVGNLPKKAPPKRARPKKMP